MSLFDDLIPRAQPQRSSMFADLIPQDEESPRLPAMDTAVPRVQSDVANRSSSVSRRDGRTAPAVQEPSQPLSDFGQRAVRGATEVVAGVPEALGIMQSGGVEARIEDTQGGISVRQEQIDSITQRLSDPSIPESERQFREQQLADLQQGQEAIAGQVDTLRDRASIPTQERPIYQLGDRIRDRSTEVFGAPDPQFDDRFGSKLSEGAGNMLGFAATTALTGWIGGAATGAALNSSSLYREAIDSGATEEDARRAAAIGAAIGTTEVIPIGRALDRFTGKAKDRLTGAISRRLASALETAGEEGVQEAAVTIANNLTAAGIYDPDRQWSEGALESAAIGAVLGGGLGALTPAPVTPRSRDDDDRERLNSPRLTPGDRASPLPNDIIDDGKAALDDLLSNSPQQPQAGVAPLDEAAPNVRLPEVDVVQRPLPTDRLSPTLGVAPQADVAPTAPTPTPEQVATQQPTQRLSEPMEDSQTPGRMVRIDLDTGAVVPEPVAEVPTAPVQQPAPQGRNLSEPMEDSQTGQTVQVDLDTGETVQQPRGADAQATPEPVPTENVAVPEMADTAPTVPVAPTEAPARPTVSRERLKRRPLTDLLKAEGVQPGSPLAVELSARGIDQRTTPGLFKAGGRTDWDNLPVSEWSDFSPIVGDDGNGYLSRDGLIEAVENEMRGQPVQVGEQARLQERRDLREYAARFEGDDTPAVDLSDIPDATISIPALSEDIQTDAERRQMVVRSIDGMAQKAGLSDVLTAAERQEAANTLMDNGGNVEDVLWGVVYRSVESGEDRNFAAPEADAQNGGVEVAPAREQGAERLVIDGGAENRDAPRNEDAGRADERATGSAESVTPELSERMLKGLRRASGSIGWPDTVDGAELFQASKNKWVYTTGPGQNSTTSRYRLTEEGQRVLNGVQGNTVTESAPAQERTSAPSEPATERTDAGEQTVMPGVAPITEQDRQRNELERRANAPMAGRDFGPGSGRDDLFGAPEDRRDLFDAPQSNVDQETSAPEINEVEAEPAENAEPDQETPADMGAAAAQSGDDRRPPVDMSSEDTTAWLEGFDAEVQRQIAESKAASINSGGKVIEGQPKVKVAEYKPAPNAPTLQEPQTAQPIDDRAREMARLAKVADKLEEVGRRAIEKANEDINAPRQENTARRARMAANAIGDATTRLRNGETAVQIAEAMRNGEADALETVRSIKDIERIDAELKSAQYERLRDAGGRVSNAGPPTKADLANVKAPSLLVRQGEITSLLDATKGKRGVDRRALQGMEGRSLDGFMRVKGRDADVIEAALKVAKKSGPLAYGLKNMADDITKYRALERMVGDDPQGFYAKYLEVRSGATVQPDPLKAVRRGLIGNKIPGFFETPEALAQRMVEEAGISQGDRVLEPSGGLGRIATKLAEAAGKENVTVLEINPTLNSALREQGFNVVGSDFMEFEAGAFDAVVMNPPFEKRQDAEHVMRAHELVKPGGRVVAIMGEGVFFGSDAKAVEFRKWLDDLGGTSEKLPEGTFKESGTGVNTRIVVVDKAEAAVQPAPKSRLFEDKPAGATVMGLGGLDATQVPAAEKIQDFGEKIGGARKDTAESGGSRRSRASTDNRPAWRKRYTVMENWDLKATDADKSKWMILDTKTNRPVRDGYRTKLFDSQDQAEAAVPLYEVARNHRVYAEGDGFAIKRVVSDRKRPAVKDGFATREEAMKYMTENPVEIIEFKTRIDDSIHPALEQAIRVGEERRAGGRDVVAQDFGDIFGFRGVEFGNWNNGPERQHILNQAYDAFLDMAEIIRVPPKALSLNGELALAFGARGQGLSSAKAHYERNHATINLTKIKGAGSLAHEWWHAADHYLSRLDGKASSERIEKTAKDSDGKPYTYWVFDAKDAKTDYASWGFLYKSGMRQELQDAIKGVMDAISKRKMEFTEDLSTREKIAERRMGSVDQLLKQWRDGLATEQRYGRKTAPATPEHLKRFDAAAERLRKGDLGEMVNAPSKGRYSFRFYEPILEIAEINKEVRGRQSYGVQQNRMTGDAVRLQHAIEARQKDEQFLEDAKAQKVKEKTVRSEYYSNSWAIDQGQSTDYWSTNHELAARAFESFVYDRLKEIDARNDFLAYEKHNDLPEYRMFNVKPYPEGQERADINAAFEKLFDVMETTTNTDDGAVMMYQRGDTAQQTKATIWPNLPELRAELDKMGLTDVNLQTVDPDPTYQGALRIDRKGGMTVLIGASLDPTATLRHEAIHALSAMDLFKGGEWRLLTQRAQRDWMAKHDIEARYPELSRLEQIEEAIAEEYAAWAKDGAKSGNGAFAKIKKFLEALGNMLRGQGFQTVEDVFGSVSDGVVGGRDPRDAAQSVRTQEQPDTFAADFLRELSAVDDLFAYPKSTSTTVEGVFAEIDPMVEFIGETQTPEETADKGADEKYLLRSANGKDFYVYVNQDEVWIDVSQVGEGGGGNSIYSAVGDFAYNTDRKFIGDPDGLSKIALRRRTEAMLSSALKHRTTDHLAPHQYQLKGDERFGVPPLPWTRGDTVGNIQSLIKVSNASLTSIVPEVENARYDLQTRTFQDSQGKRISDATLDDFRDRFGRIGEAGAGRRTLKRGILYATLLRQEGGKRPGLLERALRQPDKYVNQGDLAGIFYQRPNPNAAGREAIARGTNTPMIPDRQVFDEALRDNSAILARASGVKGAVRDNLDNVRLAIQDRMLPLRRAEEAVAELTGNVIDKAESAYFAEERYSGRVGFRLDAIRDEFTNPIARLIGGAGKKLSLTDPKGETVTGTEAADLYLWARHAKERNARISKINPSMGGPTLEDPYATGTGSGMTDAQADAIIAQAEKSLARKTYRDIGAMADKLGQDMIKWREDAGLLSNEEAAIWRAMYKHYVPLRGFAETDMHDAIANEVQIGSGGSKYGARGKESKTAMGRSSQAYSPLSTMLAMAEEVTVRAEKNLVARTLYNLAEKHPAPAMWRIKTPETKRYFNSATGTVETRVVDPAQAMPKPNEVALKINGIEKRVELIDPGMARAMSQLGTMEMGAVTRFASMFSRLFSATNTMLSPPFVIVNAFRDMVTAQINLGQLPKELRGKIRTAAVRDWMKSFGGSYSEMRGGGSSEYAQYFREFSEVGAKVSFWKIENPEVRSDQLRKAVRRESGGVLNQMFWKNATVDTDVNPVLNWIETINLAVDNSVRLSVYVEARKQGVSIEEAASLSKNLTVNFNRRGEWGATMNAWFPFANAAVQGSHVLIKAMKAPQVQALLGSAVLTGFAMEFLNAALSEEDEDGELAHDKIPDYISQRNLIIPTGADSRVTIPLPYGYNVFFYAGQQMAKAMRGVKDEGRVIGDVTKATFGAFSPISGEGLAQTIMPTLGDHMMELATNTDWLGRPIRPEQPFGDYGPQAYKMFKNEPPEAFQFVSDMLNKGTGGNELEAGLIDVSPEYLHHTFKFLTGGAGRFVSQVGDITGKVVTGDGDLVEAHQVPLLRTLRYQPSEFLDQGRYFEFRTSVNNARAMVEKRAPELGIDPRDGLVKMAGLYPQLRGAERQRRAISERMDTIYADSTLSFRERRERLAPLEKQRQEVYIRFNRAYVEAMGPQAQ